MVKQKSSSIGFIDFKINLCGGKINVRERSGDNTMESHIHNKCEIYINLSGNVAFMVENRIYPIKSGDIIITRPYEAHHCIYYKTEEHDHYCINFSCDEGDELFRVFFDRKNGEGNLITLPTVMKEKMIDLCNDMLEGKSKYKKCVSFLKLVELLSKNTVSESASELPYDMGVSINYIKENFANDISVKDLAKISHTTVNTLERHFKKYLGVSPYTYIQNSRLAYAVSILEDGGSVLSAAEESGFSDYSHFISFFKKTYGKTPLQYKKEM